MAKDAWNKGKLVGNITTDPVPVEVDQEQEKALQKHESDEEPEDYKREVEALRARMKVLEDTSKELKPIVGIGSEGLSAKDMGLGALLMLMGDAALGGNVQAVRAMAVHQCPSDKEGATKYREKMRRLRDVAEAVWQSANEEVSLVLLG